MIVPLVELYVDYRGWVRCSEQDEYWQYEFYRSRVTQHGVGNGNQASDNIYGYSNGNGSGDGMER